MTSQTLNGRNSRETNISSTGVYGDEFLISNISMKEEDMKL